MKNSSYSPQRILLVDDDKMLSVVVGRGIQLMAKDSVIDTVNNADEALIKLQGQSYTLLITDYNMPKTTGLTLAQEVRQKWPNTYIILMTAYGTPQLRETSQSLGIHGYITKPFSLNKLRTMINEVLNS